MRVFVEAMLPFMDSKCLCDWESLKLLIHVVRESCKLAEEITSFVCDSLFVQNALSSYLKNTEFAQFLWLFWFALW